MTVRQFFNNFVGILPHNTTIAIDRVGENYPEFPCSVSEIIEKSWESILDDQEVLNITGEVVKFDFLSDNTMIVYVK